MRGQEGEKVPSQLHYYCLQSTQPTYREKTNKKTVIEKFVLQIMYMYMDHFICCPMWEVLRVLLTILIG